MKNSGMKRQVFIFRVAATGEPAMIMVIVSPFHSVLVNVVPAENRVNTSEPRATGRLGGGFVVRFLLVLLGCGFIRQQRQGDPVLP